MSTVTLEHYVAMAAAIAGRSADQYPAALAEVGSTVEQWQAASMSFIMELAQSTELQERYNAALEEALQRQLGGAREMSLDDYVRVSAATRTGSGYDEACRATGMDRREIFLACLSWQRRITENPRLFALVEAKIRVAAARPRGDSPGLAPPRPAPVVFAHRCEVCGGRKRTEPRTAYIYCDYCGQLFDYDWERARATLDADLPGLLQRTIADELAKAREAGDWVSYRQLWYWFYDVDMEVAPEGWSPRVGDPAYRKAMIEWSVETCVIRNTDAEMKRMRRDYRDAMKRLERDESAEAHCRRFELYTWSIDREVDIYSRHGLLQAHPDRLSASVYRRVNLSCEIAELSRTLNQATMDRVLDMSGLRGSVVDVAPVSLTKSLCGSCGGQLLVVEGAQQLVCEACGVKLGAAARFTCPACGAPVLSGSATDLTCGYCNTRFRC